MMRFLDEPPLELFEAVLGTAVGEARIVFGDGSHAQVDLSNSAEAARRSYMHLHSAVNTYPSVEVWIRRDLGFFVDLLEHDAGLDPDLCGMGTAQDVYEAHGARLVPVDVFDYLDEVRELIEDIGVADDVAEARGVVQAFLRASEDRGPNDPATLCVAVAVLDTRATVVGQLVHRRLGPLWGSVTSGSEIVSWAANVLAASSQVGGDLAAAAQGRIHDMVASVRSGEAQVTREIGGLDEPPEV